MSMDVDEVCVMLADQIAGDVPSLAVLPYPPDQIPAGVADFAYVEVDGVDYWEAFSNGLAFLRLQLTVNVQLVDPRSAHTRIRDLLSSGTGETRSIIDAVMADRTVGGLTGGMIVDTATRPHVESDGEQRRLVSELTMRIPIGRL